MHSSIYSSIYNVAGGGGGVDFFLLKGHPPFKIL